MGKNNPVLKYVTVFQNQFEVSYSKKTWIKKWDKIMETLQITLIKKHT